MTEQSSSANRNGYGGTFVALLTELGYEEGGLHADIFDWLFGLPSMRIQAFLEWFLTAIRPRNSVKHRLAGPKEYALYLALLRGECGGLLSEEELVMEEMASMANDTTEKEESLDHLLASNAQLEDEIRVLERKLHLANAKNDKLAIMVQNTTQHVDVYAQQRQQMQETEYFNELLMEMVGPHAGESYIRRHNPQEMSSQIDAMIDALLQTNASDDAAMVENGGDDRPTSSVWKEFLYQEMLAPLCESEMTVLQQSKAKILSIVNRHSHPTVGKLEIEHKEGNNNAELGFLSPRRDGKDSTRWLFETDPLKLQLHEQDAQIYNKCCLELARLEQAFIVSEQDTLLAHMQLAKNECHWKQLLESRHFLYKQYQLMSSDAVWAKRQELLAAIESTKQEISTLVHRLLPDIFAEMAFLKTTTILLGNYEQKLWRQEHRFLKLRTLLNDFDHQHARLKLAHRILDTEHGDLQHISSKLHQIVQLFEDTNQQSQDRTGMNSTTNINTGTRSTNNMARSSLADMDEVAHALYSYLEQLVEGKERTDQRATQSTSAMITARHPYRFRTFDEMVRLCDRKNGNEVSLKESMAQIEHEWLRFYEKKKQALLALRREMFGDLTSSTSLLLPIHLTSALEETIEAKNQTDQELHNILEQHRMKKRAIAVDLSIRSRQEENFLRLQQELQARKTVMME